MAAELNPGQQQIGTHGDPYLGHDSVFGCANKGFDFQVLLDAFEEQFDLPAGFVDISNGLGGKMEVVGQKHIVLAGFSITEADPAQRNWASLCLCAGDQYGLITCQAFGFNDLAAFDNTVRGITFLSSNEKYSFVIQGLKPCVIGIGTIHYHNAISREFKDATDSDIVLFAIANADKAGK